MIQPKDIETPRSVRPLRWLEQWFAFHSLRQAIWCCLLVVTACGALSIWRGQDISWDLRNYHIYNGYAWLHGRIHQDLAPAQLQSYFSPVLDVFQYLLITQLPAVLVAFLLGAFHGLIFAPLALIAWHVLDGHARRAHLAPVLALAGLVSSAAFISEMGTAIGDSFSAVWVVTALALTTHAQRRDALATKVTTYLWSIAGISLGVALACKLTNAVYVAALGVMTLSAARGIPVRHRLGQCLLLALGCLVTFALLAGDWYWHVWRAFGNPLFPQFNAWFHAPLALPVQVTDGRWLPRSVFEQVVWPVIFTLDPFRVSEIPLIQCVWLLLYLLALGFIWRVIFRRKPSQRLSAAGAALLLYALVAYLLWQRQFSIARYLLALDVLAPMLLWQLCQAVFPSRMASRCAFVLVGLGAGVGLLGSGMDTWGHAARTDPAVAVTQASGPDYAKAIVLLVGDEPQSWRIPFLPAAAAYASVASNFPESAAYRAQIDSMLSARPEHFAMLPATSSNPSPLHRARFVVAWIKHGKPAACAAQAGHLSSKGTCVLDPLPPGFTSAADRQIQLKAEQKLSGYGLRLDPSRCQRLAASIGNEDLPYQWCPLLPAMR